VTTHLLLLDKDEEVRKKEVNEPWSCFLGSHLGNNLNIKERH
jgi:hypothetical protein